MSEIDPVSILVGILIGFLTAYFYSKRCLWGNGKSSTKEVKEVVNDVNGSDSSGWEDEDSDEEEDEEEYKMVFVVRQVIIFVKSYFYIQK